MNRLVLKHFEGVLLWLPTLGVEVAADIPITGWEVHTHARTGVRLVPLGPE